MCSLVAERRRKSNMEQKIQYIAGDLFEFLPMDKKVICPHIVNDCKLWGSGFVVPLGKHFPDARKIYFEQEKLILGTCNFAQITDDLIVANMVGQHGIIGINNPHPIRYGELRDCMLVVREKALSIPGCEIHAPKFGSQRAGGEWSKITELIEEIWITRKIPVCVYYLEDIVASAQEGGV